MIGTLARPLRRILVPVGFPFTYGEEVDLALGFSARNGSVITLGYVGPSPRDPATFSAAFAAFVDSLSVESESMATHHRFEREMRFTTDWVDGVITLASEVHADLIVAAVPTIMAAGRFAAAWKDPQLAALLQIRAEGGL